MTPAGRHDHYLELAAAGLDFALTPAESLELDGHLAGCVPCARAVAGLRADAAALRRPAEVLPSRRTDAVVALAISGRPPRTSLPRALVLVAATALMLVALLGAAAVGAMLQRTRPPQVVVPTPQVPAWVVEPSAAPTVEPTAPPGPAWMPVPASLPVAAGEPRLAVGPDGGLYVVVDDPGDGTVIALLDSTGWPRDGWPIRIPGAACASADASQRAWQPAVAPDGSVRLVCRLLEPADGEAGTFLAYAFHADGTLLRGWPAPLPRGDVEVQPRLAGDRLAIAMRDGDTAWVTEVEQDGSVTLGMAVSVASSEVEQLGDDATAYAVHPAVDGAAASSIIAFDHAGVLTGWPVAVGSATPGIAPAPGGGLVVAVVESGSTRLLAIERGGRLSEIHPGLPIEAVGERRGPEAAVPAPLVGDDGTVYVVGEDAAGAVAFAVDATGATLPGWPFHDGSGLQWQETCGADVAGCGAWRAQASIGGDGTLYLPLEVADPDHGGRIAGIRRDGGQQVEWPVELAKPGAEFWSAVVKPDGTVHMVAVEPEAAGATSATILGVAPDGTVRVRTTVVEP